MYDEQVKNLRICAEGQHCDKCGKWEAKQNGGMNACQESLCTEAADAIEELSRFKEECDACGSKTQSVIESLQKKIPRWIPVTERLPEDDKNVLICYEWTGQSGTVYREVGIASIEELKRDPTELFRPLHWMPLPQPPKEET